MSDDKRPQLPVGADGRFDVPSDVAKIIREGSITADQIADCTVTAARIEHFNPDELGPVARAHWDQLGRRLKLHNEYDAAHPVLQRMQTWPIIGDMYCAARLRFVLEREPQLPS